VCLLAFALLLLVQAGGAHAIEAIQVRPELEKIDVTALGELYEGRGDRLQIETAPGPDGYIGRMAVQASTPGTNPGWLVFALSNPTGERIVRWLALSDGEYRPVQRSGLIDLAAEQLAQRIDWH